MKTIQQIAESVSKGVLQDALNLDKSLSDNNLTWDNLRTWWEGSKSKQPKLLPTKQCPDCDSVMTLGNDAGFKHWYCKKCGNGLPLKETTNERI